MIIPKHETEWHHSVVLVSVPFLPPSLSITLYWFLTSEKATLYKEKPIGPETKLVFV